MSSLQGRVVLVAGAGPGIGRASVLLFAQNGARVFFTSRTQRIGKETESLAQKQGYAVTYLQANMSQESEVIPLRDKIFQEAGPVDVLFNNSGTWAGKDILESDDALLESLVQTNLKSMFVTAKVFLPSFVERKKGVLIHTAGVFGPFVTSPKSPIYNATKAAVVALTKSLALDYARYNIRVNCICPGEVSHTLHTSPLEKNSALSVSQTLCRKGTPEDIAHAVLFLSSDEAAWITGATLNVDGGRSCGVL